MSSVICPWFKCSFLGMTLLAAAVCGRPAEGQSAPPPIRAGGVEITGIPEDWSDSHIVFSDPGTEQEAIQSGRHERWQRIVNDPRYVMHQMKRNAPVQGPAAADVEARSRWASEATGSRTPLEESDESRPPEGFSMDPSRPIRRSNIKTDWSQGLGGPSLAAGHYPAKYSLAINPASCSDYVVFLTGVAGSSGQATIVAFTNLYVGGGCGTTNPTVYWAYNTGQGATAATGGGVANTSPVLSLDGSQVAFVETISFNSYLVILKMAQCSGCSVANPDTTIQYFDGDSGTTAQMNYRTCANGTGACYITFSLGGSDSNSAPFVAYDTDTLWVGNDANQLYQFTGVFKGTPSNPSFGLFVNVGSTVNRLNSPVYDSGTQQVFLATGQVLRSISSTTKAIAISGIMDCSTTGFQSPPLVDSTAGKVYVFIGNGCDQGSNVPGNRAANSYINRFVTAGFPGGTNSTGSFFNFGNLTSANVSTSTIGNLGAFDNAYLMGTGTGNLYACVNGIIYQLPNPNGAVSGTLSGSFRVLATSPSSTSGCSPVTQFQDRLFVSLKANGTGSGCGSGCVYSLNLPTPPVTIPSMPVSDGTSGIIIDNRNTLTGAQQIYFSTLSNPSNAVQASQSLQ